MSEIAEMELANTVGHWRKQWDMEVPQETLSTGLETLDEALGGGLIAGEVFTVGANTGCGKSSFGVNLAARVAEQGKPSVLFTFEMTPRALAARVNQTYSGVNSKKIQTKRLTEKEAIAVADADGYISDLPLYLSYGSFLTPDTIGPIMERYVEELGAELFIFDYVQKMNKASTEGKQFGVETAMESIRKAAKEVVDKPVCVLSQLNREAGKRGDPTIYDMRDSGAIENESDIILLIDPVEPRPASGWHKPVEFNFILGKQREGGGTVIPVTFIPHKVRFED